MKTFGGKALFLDRSDINTDEIIPAKYLTEITKEALKPYLLEDLKLPGFDSNKIQDEQPKVIITRANFGCGSSREHAPWALEVNGIHCVVAESYARIFRQNMFNCGMLAIELPKETMDEAFLLAKKGAVECSVDLNTMELTFKRQDGIKKVADFKLSEFDAALVAAGGWLEFADARY
jgi:3-isopropylmalate/(R)-2-methylmalate dehydratase small subunit